MDYLKIVSLRPIQPCSALINNQVPSYSSLRSSQRRFDFGPKDHGQFMSFIGLSYAMSQGFIAKRVVAFSNGDSTTVLIICSLFLVRFSELQSDELPSPSPFLTPSNLICDSLRSSQGCGRLVAYRASSLYTVYVTFFFIIASLGTSNTVLTEAATRVSSDDAGGVFGALTAVESLAGMVGPVLGGYLSNAGEEVPIAFVVLVYLACACWVKVRFEAHFGGDTKKVKAA